jgi:hypothetical protein
LISLKAGEILSIDRNFKILNKEIIIEMLEKMKKEFTKYEINLINEPFKSFLILL